MIDKVAHRIEIDAAKERGINYNQCACGKHH
jgi:hypothetical protein